jgi:hypothetical protein
LYAVWSAQYSRYKVEIFNAFDDDDFNGIINCMNVFSNSNPICGAGGNVFLRRSFSSYGDTFLRQYAIVNGQIDLNAAELAQGTTPFFPTEQFYYNTQGWSFIPDRQGDRIYVESFDNGIGAAIRDFAEVCGSCLRGSLPVPFSTAYAAVALGATSPTTNDGIEVQAQSLINVMKGMTDEIFVEAYVGYSNSEFYGIGDCRSRTQSCPDERQGPDNEVVVYAYYVRAESYFGNPDLHTLFLNDRGENITEATRGDPYDPTVRPWFVNGTGWAPSFTSATTGRQVRSYSVAFNGGGVTAAEIELDHNGLCFAGRNGQYEPSFYCSSAEKVVMSLSLVFLAIVFALF